MEVKQPEPRRTVSTTELTAEITPGNFFIAAPRMLDQAIRHILDIGRDVQKDLTDDIAIATVQKNLKQAEDIRATLEVTTSCMNWLETVQNQCAQAIAVAQLFEALRPGIVPEVPMKEVRFKQQVPPKEEGAHGP